MALVTATQARVAVVTGSRADYGFLRWLFRSVDDAPDLDLLVVATGMHLVPDQGLTVEHIARDGFEVDARVPVFSDDDSRLGMAHALGDGVSGIADALERLAPDWVVILGDRIEALAAALAAHTLRIPIAHIHGGELTYGALDDDYRHAITKLSYLHFASTEEYRRRIVQLGESPDRVFNVGALAVESVTETELVDQADLELQLGVPLGSFLLVTYHPVTHDQDLGLHGLQELLIALDRFPELSVVATYPNSDAHGRVLRDELLAYAKRRPESVACVPAVGQSKFINLLRLCTAAVGNSSSSLIEAAIIGTSAVDIGPRQGGRFRPPSVIHVEPEAEQIAAAISAAISPSFTRSVMKTMPFGGGDASGRIARILATTKVVDTGKHFVDVVS